MMILHRLEQLFVRPAALAENDGNGSRMKALSGVVKGDHLQL